MDLNPTQEEIDFRDGVRAFLNAHWAPVVDKADADTMRTFRLLAIEKGYLYRNIPRRYGGSEQPQNFVVLDIVQEEFDAVGAPREVAGMGVAFLVPTLLEVGEEWQKERFVQATLMGDISWAQGFSEPGSGSDLASVSTRAELRDAQWVINGQKIWNSHTYRSDYMFVLVRTHPELAKHRGLSFLLIDLKQPGITINRVRQLSGRAEFCHTFFDDAKTPADWIVGAPGEGWKASTATLKHERLWVGDRSRTEGLFNSLLEVAKTTVRDGEPAINDPDLRRRLAALHAYMLAIRYSGYRQMSMGVAGKDSGLFAMMRKITATYFEQQAAKISADLLGGDLLLAMPAADNDLGYGDVDMLRHQFMRSVALAIAGGTSNIQRNVLAERGLGLPRG